MDHIITRTDLNMKGKKNLFIIVIACIFALCAVISAASASSVSAEPSSLTLTAGSTTNVKISVDSLPSGLAGYSLKVSLSNPAAGTIVSVQYPGWGVLNHTSSLPASSVDMSAVDITRQVGATNTPLELGTVTIRSDNGGTTGIIIANEVLDGDGGGVVINNEPIPTSTVVPTTSGSVSVTTSGSSVVSSGGSTGGSSGGSGSTSSLTSSSSSTVNAQVTTAVTNGATLSGTASSGSNPTPKVTTLPVTNAAQGESPVKGESVENNQVAPASNTGNTLPVPMWLITIVGIIAVIAAVTLVYLAWSKKI